MLSRLLGSLVLFSGIFLSTASHALPVNLFLEGTINAARNTNPYNLSVGDTVFASASFDNNLISSSGFSEIGFGTTGNAFGDTLSLTIGSRSFTEVDDIDYFGFLFPTLSFNNGAFEGIDFVTEFGRNNNRLFVSSGLSFDGINQNNGRTQIAGMWDTNSLSITPTTAVPEPSSMMLLGLGLLGLVGAKRKI